MDTYSLGKSSKQPNEKAGVIDVKVGQSNSCNSSRRRYVIQHTLTIRTTQIRKRTTTSSILIITIEGMRETRVGIWRTVLATTLTTTIADTTRLILTTTKLTITKTATVRTRMLKTLIRPTITKMIIVIKTLRTTLHLIILINLVT